MAKKKSAPPSPKPKAAGANGGDHDFVRDLALILRETELSEIEVERNGLRVRVARQMTAAPATMAYAAPPGASMGPPSSAQHQSPAPVATPTTSAERAAHPGAVKSPMVGTAYQSPSPGSAAFVKVGDTVKEGQTLLIIEAMKTMNQIASPRAGRVIEILFKDAQPVEFGEVLVIVE